MADDLVTTRLAWHALGEHVLAPYRHRHTGRIGLTVVEGGFGTPWVPTTDGDRQVAVVGMELHLSARAGRLGRWPLTTLSQAASPLGIEPGAPTDVYTPTTALEPDAPLRMDPAAVGELAAWFALGDEALRAFVASDRESGETVEPTLWPEHFDLAVTVDEVNYGFSPGDDGSPEPYAYVGPWSGPGDDDFWNASFGASRTRSRLADRPSALAFLEEGRRRAADRRRS